MLAMLGAVTWGAWACIGFLSGHLFFLVSRGGPAHFSGLPALIFAGAVLACAVACMTMVVDHYDRRDNEAAYRRLKKQLWWGAGALFLVAILVAVVFLRCRVVHRAAARVWRHPFVRSRGGQASGQGDV